MFLLLEQMRFFAVICHVILIALIYSSVQIRTYLSLITKSKSMPSCVPVSRPNQDSRELTSNSLINQQNVPRQ
jgi:hypothetical protein